MKQSLVGLRGIVTDSINGQPLKSRVEIFNHDIDSSHVYSNLPVGNYHRYLSPGNYAVNFSCSGYQSKSLNVDVFNGNASILDVQLVPLSFVGIIPQIDSKKVIKEVDILGREGSNNAIKIKIYNDGSSIKTINHNNK